MCALPAHQTQSHMLRQSCKNCVPGLLNHRVICNTSSFEHCVPGLLKDRAICETHSCKDCVSGLLKYRVVRHMLSQHER